MRLHGRLIPAHIGLCGRPNNPGKANGCEVDFLARHRDGAEDLIQVCADPDEAETLAREVRALEDAAAAYPRARQLLLTLESRMPFPAVPKPIRILPAWQWILESAGLPRAIEPD